MTEKGFDYRKFGIIAGLSGILSASAGSGNTEVNRDVLKEISQVRHKVVYLTNGTEVPDGPELRFDNWRTPSRTGVTLVMRPMKQERSWRVVKGEQTKRYNVRDWNENGFSIYTFANPKQPNDMIAVRANKGRLTLDTEDTKHQVQVIMDDKFKLVPNATVAKAVLWDLSTFERSSERTGQRKAFARIPSAGLYVPNPDGTHTFAIAASVHAKKQK